ncbi:hypothetical protein AYI69_g11434 [Smittium culicis]|uniref:Uncharacterized protein n=1 Tax=Smittium culicis TaxID=133412 RepID=A0A1R1WYS3_9FUNG|nr:hypothetical protein AYI69_g11434 [Smittium culicis]
MTITQAIRSCSPSCFYNLDRIEKRKLCKSFVDFASEFSASQIISFGFEFSRTQFNTAKQKASEDQFNLDDYQRHIPKSRSAVVQTVVDLVKSYLQCHSQPSSIAGRRLGEDRDGIGTPVYVSGLKVEKMYRSVVSSHGIDSERARKLMKTYQYFKDHKMLVEEQRGRFISLEENLKYHGKSYVDGHFGVLSKRFDESEYIMNITSIDDLMGVFRSKTSDLAAQRGVYTDNFAYKFIKYYQYTPRNYKC